MYRLSPSRSLRTLGLCVVYKQALFPVKNVVPENLRCRAPWHGPIKVASEYGGGGTAQMGLQGSFYNGWLQNRQALVQAGRQRLKQAVRKEGSSSPQEVQLQERTLWQSRARGIVA